jgi:hypothetical protein
MIKYLFLVTYAAILLFGCIEQQTVNPEPTTGHIEGYVYFKTIIGQEPINDIIVEIAGTSFWARTDSAGHYRIFNLPEGEYTLKIRLWDNSISFSKKIKVVVGEKSLIDNIVLGDDYNYGEFFIFHLRIANYYNWINHNDTAYYDISLLESDSAVITGSLILNYYTTAAFDTLLTMEIGNKTYFTESKKGRFSFKIPVEPGANIIRIWQGHSQTTQDFVFKSTLYLLDIIPVTVDLSWNTEYEHNAGDFDIHLIQKETGDSCWYKNPKPDWGIEKSYFDNPTLYDEKNESNYNNGYERLFMRHAPDGNYLLKIVYFNNLTEPKNKIMPQVGFTIDGEYNTYSAPAEMSVGQVWTVLEFNAPERTINLINTISSGGTLAKREAKY